jgi:hypothetical protein
MESLENCNFSFMAPPGICLKQGFFGLNNSEVTQLMVYAVAPSATAFIW